MQTIKESFEATYETKRSVFHAHLVPYRHFKETLEHLRRQHPKATHIVTAYRYLNSYNQVVEHSSDDGEPKGCAGVPILNVLRGNDMIESALLVVRYFGGIKLGSGGMVRAYGASAKAVIERAHLIPFVKKETLRFTTPYAQVQRVEYLLQKGSIQSFKRSFGPNGVEWEIALKPEQKKLFEQYTGEKNGV